MKHRRRILIADGSSAVLAFERLLLGERFDVIAARDGAQAVAWAVAQRPDLIVMEAALPHMSGIAACRAIRGYEILRTVPIIIVTCRDDEECEGNDYIRKPIRAAELVGKVDRLLGL